MTSFNKLVKAPLFISALGFSAIALVAGVGIIGVGAAVLNSKKS